MYVNDSERVSISLHIFKVIRKHGKLKFVYCSFSQVSSLGGFGRDNRKLKHQYTHHIFLSPKQMKLVFPKIFLQS